MLLFFLASLFPKRGEYLPGLPNVSILIAAYNEQNIISDKLENTLALDYPIEKIQIIVAADGSSDSSADIVANYSKRGVELIGLPGREFLVVGQLDLEWHLRLDALDFFHLRSL